MYARNIRKRILNNNVINAKDQNTTITITKLNTMSQKLSRR